MFIPRFHKRILFAALILPFLVNAQTSSTGQLNVSVVVLPVMKVIEEAHTLNAATGNTRTRTLSATQRLLVFSNLSSGFCVTLEQTSAQVGKWSVDLIPTTEGVTLTSTANGGYLLCAKSIGRKTIDVQHNFSLKSGTPITEAFPWPVSWSIASP